MGISVDCSLKYYFVQVKLFLRKEMSYFLLG